MKKLIVKNKAYNNIVCYNVLETTKKSMLIENDISKHKHWTTYVDFYNEYELIEEIVKAVENNEKILDLDKYKLRIFIKIRDEFYCKILNENEQEILKYEGYVPDFMPTEHCGDYIDLEINMKTGQITNWKENIENEVYSFINKKYTKQ
jgi:hypothetical protein